MVLSVWSYVGERKKSWEYCAVKMEIERADAGPRMIEVHTAAADRTF